MNFKEFLKENGPKSVWITHDGELFTSNLGTHLETVVEYPSVFFSDYSKDEIEDMAHSYKNLQKSGTESPVWPC